VARVHYEIPDDLHRRAKATAAMRGITLKDLLIEALEAATRSNLDGPTEPGGAAGGSGRKPPRRR
jgi:hypothetical protein